MSEKERMSVYTTIAAVLHLGNVEFEVQIYLALKQQDFSRDLLGLDLFA